VSRLIGERVTLIPVPHAVAVAVTTGDGLDRALGGLRAAPGWPHPDSADALRPHAEHGGPGPADGTFLIAVDNQVAGECGWLGGPNVAGEVEIGYGLATSARGRGLGTQAVAMLCAWVEQQAGVRRIVASARIGNEPSRRLLRRLGFSEEPAPPPYVGYGRDLRHIDQGDEVRLGCP
jgi:RimJ/RimL family protein N-acetyltransferase